MRDTYFHISQNLPLPVSLSETISSKDVRLLSSLCSSILYKRKKALQI